MDYERRDNVMRAYFRGRDWDGNPEYQLKRKLVMEGHPLLATFPYFVDDEWEVEAGTTNNGKGDLVFADGRGRFAVVEVKWMHPPGAGRNRGTRRNDQRNAVREQAPRYARAVLSRVPQAVEVVAMTLTNDWQCPGLTQIAVLTREDVPLNEPRPALPRLEFSFPGLVRRKESGGSGHE